MRKIILGWQRHISGISLIVASLCLGADFSLAGTLPLPPEPAVWSDLVLPNVDSGTFNAVNKRLTITTTEFPSLEIGPQFGPNPPLRHYGTGGSLGGAFSATLNVLGVVIEPDGTVSNGGSVRVIHNNSTPGSVGDDYGVAPGANLLTGVVTEVLLDPIADTLDVLFTVTGGALQSDNPATGVGVFASGNVGLLRFAGKPMPSDWSASFSLTGTNAHVHGIPEPTGLLLASAGALMMLRVARSRKLKS